MLLAGGFRLTKFSNIKEVLLLIPEADRRQGINKKELLEFVLGNERALGVLWIPRCQVWVSISIKEKLLTRKGMLLLASVRSHKPFPG